MTGEGVSTSELELSRGTFAAFADLMYGACGLKFPEHKRDLIRARLTPRLNLLRMESFEQYLAVIAGPGDDGEFQMAVNLLTTNETYFFREPRHFRLLDEWLPHFGSGPVQIWSAASSFGDEAFSAAMLLADQERCGGVEAGWSVLGTDISERVLQSAIQGIFPEDRLREVSDAHRRRYCLRGVDDREGMVQIAPDLRRHVSFGWLNLSQPFEPMGPFHVIFLRNVLIYFDAQTREAVVNRVLERLLPGGLFFIGTAEGRIALPSPMESMGGGVFRKVSATEGHW